MLKQLRESLDLTQEELASVMGVGVRSITRWENGYREPLLTFAQMKKLLVLIDQAGLNIEDLPDELSKPAHSLVA